MANNRKKTPTTYDLKQYIHEAQKSPFPLDLDGDGEQIIEIKAPSVNVVFDLPKEEDPREAFRMLVGDDNYDPIIEKIGDESAEVLNLLMADIREHFGLGESGASSTS